jgi:Cdc6-like AAA superfamily ATPase
MSNVLELGKLTKNPFTLVPEEKVTIWAGYNDLRRQLLKIVTSCRSDNVGLSEFIVLYGDIGTGKSHALRYLKNCIENEKKTDFQSPVIYLESLKLAPKVDFLVIYRRIIENLLDHMKETANWLDSIIETSLPTGGSLHLDDLQRERERKYNDKKITPLFPCLPLLLRGIKNGDDKARKILMGYSEKSLQHENFGLLSPINNEFSATRCLGAYINLCTHGPQNIDGTSPSGRNKAFYLFIDEIELLNDYRPSEVLSINQGIRDLINTCPENTCLLFGMTGDVRDISALLDKYVMGRMTHDPIIIPPMDNEQAVLFLKEVLKNRRQNPDDPDEYPFRLDALKKIAEETSEKTARELFRNCRRVLERSVLESRLKLGEWIEVQDVEEFIS